MLKKLWNKMREWVNTGTCVDAELADSQHILMVDLNDRLKAIEDYLETTPNHIGQRYILAKGAVDVAQFDFEGIANADEDFAKQL